MSKTKGKSTACPRRHFSIRFSGFHFYFLLFFPCWLSKSFQNFIIFFTNVFTSIHQRIHSASLFSAVEAFFAIIFKPRSYEHVFSFFFLLLCTSSNSNQSHVPLLPVMNLHFFPPPHANQTSIHAATLLYFYLELETPVEG